jgi:cell division protein FtsN
MKRSDLKEKSSVFYIGKGIIILSIVVTSSLSFILGFFVGKSMVPSANSQASLVTPPAGVAQNNVGTEPKETSQFQAQQIPTAQHPELQKPPDKPEPLKMNEQRATIENKRTEQTQESKQSKESQQSKENDRAGIAHGSNQSQEPQKSLGKVKYTVQIGAFKNPSEAESLKGKFIRKGYKIFMVTAKEKKHEKLYKVMIGEFNSKREAEILSIKIKKAEGLRTFVTLKTD